MPNESVKADSTLRDELGELKADLANIKDDLKSMADNAMGRARDEARSMRDRSRARVQTSIGSMEEYVEEQPLTSVLVAFGVGLLMGKLMSHK